MTKVYLAGKLTGEPDYREKFQRAQEELEKKRYIVLNPAALPAGMSKSDYMRICFAMIDSADMVVLLPDWQDSPGARIEREHALYTGKEIMTTER